MDRQTYENLAPCLDYYEKVNISDLVFNGDILEILSLKHQLFITDSLKDSISRYVGVSPTLNKGLASLDETLWYNVLKILYKHFYNEEITLVVNQNEVRGITVSEREPLLSRDFVDQVLSFCDTYPDLEIDEILCDDKEDQSSVIVMRDKTLSTLTRGGSYDYKIGVLLLNDKLNSVSAHLIVKGDGGDTIVIPPSYYNLSSKRYSKTTKTNLEALKMLLVRVSEDLLLDEFITNHSQMIDAKLTRSERTHLSLDEYNYVRTSVLNSAYSSEIDDSEVENIQDELIKVDDYETLYGSLAHKSYIFKCTAIGDHTVDEVVRVVCDIIKNHGFYDSPLRSIYYMLGDIVFNNRIESMIAERI